MDYSSKLVKVIEEMINLSVSIFTEELYLEIGIRVVKKLYHIYIYIYIYIYMHFLTTIVSNKIAN